MSIDPAFLEVFRVCFDLDLNAPDLEEQLKEEADFCAASVFQRGADVNALIRDLSKFLHDWDPETLRQLGQVSYFYWQFDARTENLLRFAIAEIIRGLEYYRETRERRESHPDEGRENTLM